MDSHVRVGNRRLFQVFVHAAPAPLVDRLQLDRDPRSVIDVDPFNPMLGNQFFAPRTRRNVDTLAPSVQDLRVVPLGVDLDLVVVRRLAAGDLGDDLDRLAGGQQAVHPGRADADPLLAAAHPQPVELGAVQQLAEDQRDLFFEDPGAIVLDAGLIAVGGRLFHMHPDLCQDARLLAGVQRVVDRLLDGGQEGLAGVVEAQQVAVLGEELADGDVALAGGHRLGRRAAGFAAPGRLAVAGRAAIARRGWRWPGRPAGRPRRCGPRLLAGNGPANFGDLALGFHAGQRISSLPAARRAGMPRKQQAADPVGRTDAW